MFGTYRTFLALMVVASHLGGVPMIGGYAVFAFYCLSGYLMTLIMQTDYGYSFNGTARYAINRFLRIYPIYWVSILLSVLLIWYMSNDFFLHYHQSIYLPGDFVESIKNVMLFFPSFRDSPRLTPPAWALTVEIFFYILIGIGTSKNKLITLIWFACSALYHLCVFIFQLGFEHKFYTISAASLPFATGALIFYYNSKITKYISLLPGKIYYCFPLIIMLCILANWQFGILTTQSKGIFFYSNYVLCATMVAVLMERNQLPFISPKFDKWMGDLSYPIYLTHYQTGVIVIIILSAVGIELKRPSLILMFTSIPVIFLFSWIITVTLERPIETIRAKVKS